MIQENYSMKIGDNSSERERPALKPKQNIKTRSLKKRVQKIQVRKAMPIKTVSLFL